MEVTGSRLTPLVSRARFTFRWARGGRTRERDSSGRVPVAAVAGELAALETARGNPALLYAAPIDDESVWVLYECLRKRGRCDRLDLMLSTIGGSVTTARQIALLLREYVRHLTVLVPYRAWSAGTLLCLSADELVLGPMAELGPIDCQLGAAAPPPADAPGMISAEDIRTFRQMSEEWFGVRREEDRLQVLALIAQRIFPATLSSFFRFDQMVRQIAEELLRYQLPDATEDVRQRIVQQLVSGYHAHDYVMSRREARELGLRVHFPSEEEEEQLWSLSRILRAEIAEHPGARQDEEVVGVIAGDGFSARLVRQWSQRSGDGRQDRGTPRPEPNSDTRWEIDE
jgi:hypothetical protein